MGSADAAGDDRVMLDLRSQATALRPALPPAAAVPSLRDAARSTWSGRMVNEHGSAVVFEGLALQFDALARPEDAATCRLFAAEERTHGALCGAVVEALGGQALAAALESPPFPRHADVDPVEATARNVLAICCLAETVAVALIGAEYHDMPEGELRTLLGGIWADECGHSRFGWQVLPSLLAAGDAELPKRLSAYLRVAFRHLEFHELRHLPLEVDPPPEGAALGLCRGADGRALFADVVQAVIIPGLEAQGLAAADAWRLRGSSENSPT